MSLNHPAKVSVQKLENNEYKIDVIYNFELFTTTIKKEDFYSQFH